MIIIIVAIILTNVIMSPSIQIPYIVMIARTPAVLTKLRGR